jgi:hypothetical protein
LVGQTLLEMRLQPDIAEQMWAKTGNIVLAEALRPP